MSRAAWIASQPPKKRKAILSGLTDADFAELDRDWRFWARPSQLPPPGDWTYWIFNAGRGAGKTRAGSEWVRGKIASGCMRGHLIAPTAADARDVMVEGDSGLLSVCHPEDPMGVPDYEPSKRRVTWANGAVISMFSAEEAERLRGPQCEFLWADELAAWGGSKTKDLREKIRTATWDMAMFGLRLGKHPQAMVTTTPKPSALLKRLLADPQSVVSTGSTFDNAANLAPSFLSEIKKKYEGTRLGRQELYAHMLDDVPGALWTPEMFGEPLKDMPPMRRIVIGVDPSGATGDPDDGSDDIGIVVAGETQDGGYVVMDDATCNLSPAGWARRVVEKLDEHKADRIVVEVNYGGELAIANIRTVRRDAPVRKVSASRGKVVRAEPIAALYEQGRVRHIAGLGKLEEQMMHMTLDGYAGSGSPDRVDAAVWALTELSQKAEPPQPIFGTYG